MSRLFVLLTALCWSLFGQTSALEPVVSKVYRWDDLAVKRRVNGESRQILEGTTPHFKLLKVHATTVNAHSRTRPAEYSQENEELLIVKRGVLTVTVEGKTKELRANGVALIMSGDSRSLVNNTDSVATYYVIQLNAVNPVDVERGKKAGGSLMMNFDETTFIKHDKGGRRNFFDRSTAMCKRFEMHVTTLDGNVASHPPHTHPAAEILLLVNVNPGEEFAYTQETIDGVWQNSHLGDVVFLNSQVPHGLRNVGRESCTYFAFQFE